MTIAKKETAGSIINILLDKAVESVNTAQEAARQSTRLGRECPWTDSDADLAEGDKLAQAAYAACVAYDGFLARMKGKAAKDVREKRAAAAYQEYVRRDAARVARPNDVIALGLARLAEARAARACRLLAVESDNDAG